MFNLRLFDPGPGPLCPPCPFLEFCGADRTKDACRAEWGSAESGGEHVLHPARPDSLAYFDAVGGPLFDDVTARAVHVPRLPLYLPQIRVRRGLSGWLPDDLYAVKAKEVIGARKHPLTADSLRRQLGLDPTQSLLLLLFDHDSYLERLWNEAAHLLPELAAAHYDWIVAPSFSCWHPRSRYEQMYNLKRSLKIFEALQAIGASAIPRVGWGVEADINRYVSWLDSNDCVELVALDFSTYRADEDWQSQMDGLELLDRRTRRHLRYLINGPTTLTRCAELYRVVPERRLCLTNATLAPPPEPAPDAQLELIPSKSKIGRQFASACLKNRSTLKRAARTSASRRRRVTNVERDASRFSKGTSIRPMRPVARRPAEERENKT